MIEIKSIENLLPIYEAQLLTYLKIGGWKGGLLINFNVPLLKSGIRRIVHGLVEEKDKSDKDFLK
jgi:GxxExxY protein